MDGVWSLPNGVGCLAVLPVAAWLLGSQDLNHLFLKRPIVPSAKYLRMSPSMRPFSEKSFLYPKESCAVVERDESWTRARSRSSHIRQRAESASMISP